MLRAALCLPQPRWSNSTHSQDNGTNAFWALLSLTTRWLASPSTPRKACLGWGWHSLAGALPDGTACSHPSTKTSIFQVLKGQTVQAGPAILGHNTTMAGVSSVFPSPHQPEAAVEVPAALGPYLEDPAAWRVAGDVLAGVEHAQCHTVEQDHQHADPLKPPAHSCQGGNRPRGASTRKHK